MSVVVLWYNCIMVVCDGDPHLPKAHMDIGGFEVKIRNRNAYVHNNVFKTQMYVICIFIYTYAFGFLDQTRADEERIQNLMFIHQVNIQKTILCFKTSIPLRFLRFQMIQKGGK